MASRPIFVAQTDGPAFVRAVPITFPWHPGVAASQRKRNLDELHNAAMLARPGLRIMEISRFAQTDAGVALSAFNLTFVTRKGREISVECAFQASKVFERGGPFIDLLDATPLAAKRDSRLTNSGHLRAFQFFGTDWPIEPQTVFYDWIYLNALHKQPELAEVVLAHEAFTDIAFNPEKSINCQAGAVALFVSLTRRKILDSVLASPEDFLATMRSNSVSNARQDDLSQARLDL